jgi:hypothetical protein
MTTTEATFETNPVAGIFDEGSDWIFPSQELCQRSKIFPNLLAYSESRATLVVIVKRSMRGEDFALSEAGLLYVEAALDKGALKNGSKPVRAAFVVLADKTDFRSPYQLKVVRYSSAQVTRNSLNGLPPYPGRTGAYWWLSANGLSPQDDAFS